MTDECSAINGTCITFAPRLRESLRREWEERKNKRNEGEQ